MPSASAAENETSQLLKGLDDAPLRAIQIRTFILCTLVMMLDGIDNQSIGLAAPLMSEELGLDKAAMGTIFSTSQIGATIGALLFGPIGDRFGRKPALIVSIAMIALFTWATAISPTFALLLFIRFAAGLGLAGVFSSVLALTSEYAPNRLRGTMVSVIYAGYPAGAAMGGLIATVVLSHYDWRWIFYIGAILALITLVLLILWLPESIRFLVGRGDQPARVDRLLGALQLDRNALPGGPREIGDAARAKNLFGSVFRDGLALFTLLLCLLNLFVSATTKIMVVWLPTILADEGFSVSNASLAQAMFNIGALVAMASAGFLVDRLGVMKAIVPALVLGAVSVFGLGLSTGNVFATMVCAALVGVFVGVGGSGAQAMAARLFPVAIRSTGIGWGVSAARFGQIVSPMLVALVLASGTDIRWLFLGLALSPLLAALAAAAFTMRAREREMTAQ